MPTLFGAYETLFWGHCLHSPDTGASLYQLFLHRQSPSTAFEPLTEKGASAGQRRHSTPLGGRMSWSCTTISAPGFAKHVCRQSVPGPCEIHGDPGSAAGTLDGSANGCIAVLHRICADIDAGLPLGRAVLSREGCSRRVACFPVVANKLHLERRTP
eukprot:3806126-Rhodomonas_salina.2